MEQMEGTILNIYIPKEYNNGQLIDVMYRTKITFKVETEMTIENIELDQDKDNVKLHIGDKVLITKQTINGIEYIDIEKME